MHVCCVMMLNGDSGLFFPAAGVSDRCHRVMNDTEVHACCVTHTELSQWPLPALGVFRSLPTPDDQTMQRWNGV